MIGRIHSCDSIRLLSRCGLYEVQSLHDRASESYSPNYKTPELHSRVKHVAKRRKLFHTEEGAIQTINVDQTTI